MNILSNRHKLPDNILKIAKERGVSPETLINTWPSEKLKQEKQTA